MSKQTDLINVTDAITVSGSNVGIGETAPVMQLHVSGGIAVSSDNSLTQVSRLYEASGLQIDSGDAANNTRPIVFRTGGSERLRIDSAGRVTMPYQPAFNATATAGTTLGTAWATIDYAQLVSQRGSSYNASTYTFTAPISGWYQFNASWTAENNGDVDGTFVFAINGSANSNKGTVSMPNTSSSYDGHVIAACFYLAANDFVRVQRYSTVTTQTRGYNWTGNFSGFLIG